MCRLVFTYTFGKFSAIISSGISPCSSLFLLLHILVCLMLPHASLRFFFLFFALDYLYWSSFKFTNFSASLNLSLSPFSEFFISDIFQWQNFFLVLFKWLLFIRIIYWCIFVIISPFSSLIIILFSSLSMLTMAHSSFSVESDIWSSHRQFLLPAFFLISYGLCLPVSLCVL